MVADFVIVVNEPFFGLNTGFMVNSDFYVPYFPNNSPESTFILHSGPFLSTKVKNYSGTFSKI